MKKLITRTLTFLLFLGLLYTADVSATHPIAIEHLDVIVENIDLSTIDPPSKEDKEEARLYKNYNILLAVLWILFALGILSTFVCLLSRINNPENKCRRISSGLMLYLLGVVTLFRNTFTKRYERRMARREERKRERELRRRERERGYEYEEEEEIIIL